MRVRLFIIFSICLVVVIGLLLGRSWGVSAYLGGLADSILRKSPHSHKNQDLFLPAEHAKGSVLVLHGLNFDAEGMRPLAEDLSQQGYTVLMPRLSAHRGDPESQLEPQAQNWYRQINEWTSRLQTRPLVCLGYSLGGLLLLERHVSHAITCDYYIGFAPALATHIPEWAVKLARDFWPKNLRVPSAIPTRYRHADFIGLMPAFSLFDVLTHLEHTLNLPTADEALQVKGLVINDPRDIVVNSPVVDQLVRKHFPNLKIIEVQALELDRRHAYHLLVDQEHLGEDTWKSVLEAIHSGIASLAPPSAAQ